MKKSIKGWVVVNYNHPVRGREMLADWSFARTRTESIKLFCQGTNEKWRKWRNNWNFQCVRAEMTITVER